MVLDEVVFGPNVMDMHDAQDCKIRIEMLAQNATVLDLGKVTVIN